MSALKIACWSAVVSIPLMLYFAGPVGANERDFRRIPLRYAEQIAEEQLSPLLDKDYFVRRLSQISRPLGPVGNWFLSPGSLRPFRQLSFHVVVRFDIRDAPGGFLDVHIPSEGKLRDANRLSYPFGDYVPAITAAVNAVADLGGFRPELDSGRADLLIHVNLAERAQSSDGFSYDLMPRFPDRAAAGTRAGDLDEFVYVLPWTIVRLFEHAHCPGCQARALEGGEIWIQYPTRTFWQEAMARLLLDDMALARTLGLGETRQEVVGKFRTPHKTQLKPLGRSLLDERQLDTVPRPAESLLSAATALTQNFEGYGPPAAGPSTHPECAAARHAETLAARLGRAMGMVAGGLRSRGQLVFPNSDYSAEFEGDRDAVLADMSLVGYRASFDQRLDDRLTLIMLAAAKDAHGGRRPWEWPELSDLSAPILTKQIEQIVESQQALLKTALEKLPSAWRQSACSTNSP